MNNLPHKMISRQDALGIQRRREGYFMLANRHRDDLLHIEREVEIDGRTFKPGEVYGKVEGGHYKLLHIRKSAEQPAQQAAEDNGQGIDAVVQEEAAAMPYQG